MFGGVKTRVARVLTQPSIGRVVHQFCGNRIPSRGLFVDTGSPAVSDHVRATLFWGIYEANESRLVEAHLAGDLDVVELGASLGFITAFAARKLQSGRRVVAVEPNPELTPLIRRNVMANAPFSELTVVESAIDYTNTSVELILGVRNIDSRVGEAVAATKSVRVQARTLSQILEESGIRGDYALIMDIEGAEVQVLEHEREALSRARQVIVECHPVRFGGVNYTPDDLMRRFVDQHGFRLRHKYGSACVLER